ncbi:hypothetical protein GWK47_034625 [Chionoecetes opilio]|uniref:Uncharacterized protein n=1 Tax=Chionoecetes opilio TaxID=41210 RepID=A0A8J4YNT8_CHIOP|nr:hypothetical protein GWK47_034625 [Chionoecetes opilio]
MALSILDPFLNVPTDPYGPPVPTPSTRLPHAESTSHHHHPPPPTASTPTNPPEGSTRTSTLWKSQVPPLAASLPPTPTSLSLPKIQVCGRGGVWWALNAGVLLLYRDLHARGLCTSVRAEVVPLFKIIICHEFPRVIICHEFPRVIICHEFPRVIICHDVIGPVTLLASADWSPVFRTRLQNTRAGFALPCPPLPSVPCVCLERGAAFSSLALCWRCEDLIFYDVLDLQFRRIQPLESTVTLAIGRQVYAASWYVLCPTV